MGKVIVNLHRLLGVEIHKREVNGKIEECISIPLKMNGISGFKGKYLLQLWMTPKFPNPKKQSHFLSLAFHKDLYEYKKEAENSGFWEQLKYVGAVYGGFDKFNPKGIQHKTDLLEAMKKD